jgi:hypothetical protein
MKNPRSALALALGSASIAVACSAGPDLTRPPSPTAHTSAALSGSATACAPSVTVSASSCSVTVGGATCDCSDCACLTSAFESCLGDAGVASLPLPDAAGIPVSLPPLSFDDGGLPAFGWGGEDGGGSTSAACSASAVAAAKTAFCNGVDAWLTAHGSSATLDCSQVGSLSFPVTAPTTLPTTPPAVVCSAATHAAFATAQSTLAGCDPLDYVGWDTSAQLQLFEDGACEP